MSVPSYWRFLYEDARPTLQAHAQWFRAAARPSILDDGAQFARFWRMLRTLVETDCSVTVAEGAADSVPGLCSRAERFLLSMLAADAAGSWLDPTPGQWIPIGGAP